MGCKGYCWRLFVNHVGLIVYDLELNEVNVIKPR